MKGKKTNGTNGEVNVQLTTAEIENIIKVLRPDKKNNDLIIKLREQRAAFQVGQVVVDHFGVMGEVIKANYETGDNAHPHEHVDVRREDGITCGEDCDYFIYDHMNISPVVPDVQ